MPHEHHNEGNTAGADVNLLFFVSIRADAANQKAFALPMVNSFTYDVYTWETNP